MAHLAERGILSVIPRIHYQNGPKMAQNGQIWPNMAKYGPKWPILAYMAR